MLLQSVVLTDFSLSVILSTVLLFSIGKQVNMFTLNLALD